MVVVVEVVVVVVVAAAGVAVEAAGAVAVECTVRRACLAIKTSTSRCLEGVSCNKQQHQSAAESLKKRFQSLLRSAQMPGLKNQDGNTVFWF